jgi:predicted phage terminase large subunit-like protein
LISANSPSSSLPPWLKLSKTDLRRQVARELARRRLLDFTTYTFPGYIPEPAHEFIAAALDRVVEGEIKKLMLFMPPQHGKSELASVHLPAYWLGKRPDDPVLMTSYGADLAEDKSRQARDLVESDAYQDIFPGRTVSQTSRSVKFWTLAGEYRGSMLAAGVGGPVTGRGGLLGIIDDPFENWEQAMSPTVREKVWNWWRATFRTRIWEGGSFILIMTRWHEDDLAGRLLQDQGSEWTVLRLPAMAESQEERDENNRHLGLPSGQPDPLGRQAGEALCPRRYSIEALRELQKDVGSMAWMSEYQGVPRAPEGNTFKREWFSIVGIAPHVARRVRYWDKAGTAGGGAYTAGVLMALGPDGTVYVEDVVRGQWSAGTREKTILETARQDALKYGGNSAVRIWVEQEPGSGGKDSAEATLTMLAGFSARKEPASGEKPVRAEPFATYAEAGRVKVVQGLWNQSWFDEMTAVPQNKYWDQVDATSGAFNRLVGRSGRAWSH